MDNNFLQITNTMYQDIKLDIETIFDTFITYNTNKEGL